MWYNPLLEKDLVPDFAIRKGIQNLLKQRLKDENKSALEQQQEHFMDMLQVLCSSPIAINTKEANEQHYEVPTEFYKKVLGKNMKYSSGYWTNTDTTFDDSENDMLELTCKRAELKNGHKILELGCGWGSLSLFMAVKFPGSKITGVSNSTTQKEYIDNEARNRGIRNLTILTADMNVFDIQEKFDRVISVEMFEHMRNYELLLAKIAGFLLPAGKLFVHIFTHKELTYFFEVKDESDWMSKHFFTGGIMPSDHLLLYFPEHFKIKNHWRVNGTHYAKTSEAWLKNMDNNKTYLMPIFKGVYGNDNALKWWVYWRIFFMSCAGLWGYNNGNEWFVSHYLFEAR